MTHTKISDKSNYVNGHVFFFQPKLTINQPNDIYEQQADAMADKVMRMKEPAMKTFFAPPISRVQRKCADCEEEEKQLDRKPAFAESSAGRENSSADINVNNNFESYVNNLDGSGAPLSSSSKQFFESRFGNDFSDVKIHNDAVAVKSAASINALAYTSGNNIVFNEGQYAPGTESGDKLLAHELTHVVQQGSGIKQIQKSPSPGMDDSENIHDSILDEYRKETGATVDKGFQYSEDYAVWLALKTGSNIQFEKPKILREHPFDSYNRGESTGKTFFEINGNEMDGANLGVLVTKLKTAITPQKINTKDTTSATKRCRFAPDFKIISSTKIRVTTLPGTAGWTGSIDISKVTGTPQACTQKQMVPAAMTGKPTNAAYAALVESSEMEHVRELETLHNRHLVPYYYFVMNLVATGNSNQDCETNLRNKIDNRDEQAVNGFVLADIAEARKFDDPSSTHHGTMQIVKFNGNCDSVEIVAAQDHPQLPGNDPGNVQIIPPSVTTIDKSKLRVSGNDLLHDGTVLTTFSSTANAVISLKALTAYNITTINRIGPFQFILSSGSAPAAPIAGISELAIDPALYQVTIGHPNANDWMISQAIKNQIFPIINFGSARDEAYSAIALMRQYGFTNFCTIGNNEFSYFRL